MGVFARLPPCRRGTIIVRHSKLPPFRVLRDRSMNRASPRHTDVLVLGSGLAGLWCALRASRHGSVTLITKKERAESNTNYAQGGIAAVLGPEDEPALHAEDTLKAGDGLCHPDVVKAVVTEGPALIEELLSLGVVFSRDPSGSLELGNEGGHSRRRIVHAADRTGAMVEEALLAAVSRND